MVKVYKPLFELGRIVTGKTPKTNVVDYWGGNIPFITPTDIVGYNSYYQYETERYVTKKGLDTQKATLLPANSVCFSCIASIGKACLTRTFSITNQQINSIIPNDKNDYRYILYLLRYNLSYVQMIAGGSGSGTPIISKRKFEKFKFIIEDDLKIQHRIASILSAYDSLIENNTKRIRLLEKMAENLYKEWFVRFRFPGYEKAEMENGLPKGWKKVRCSDCVDVMSGGTPKTDMVDYYNGSIPFFTPKDASSGFFSFATMTTISEKGLANCNSKFYSKGTIMITARGTVGKVNIIDVPMAMNQSCFALESKTICSNFYLFFSIRNATERIKKMANGGVFDTIIVKTFDYIPLVIPNHELLISFDQKISSIMNSISCLAKQNTLLARRRDLLLPRLMSGKLEVKP